MIIQSFTKLYQSIGITHVAHVAYGSSDSVLLLGYANCVYYLCCKGLIYLTDCIRLQPHICVRGSLLSQELS